MSLAQLEKAEAALGKRDFKKALELLLAAWRDEPGIVLAELIDAVSRRAGEGLPSLRKKPLAAQWEAWREVAQAGNPVDFERLVDVPMPRKWPEAGPLISKLTEGRPDPRVARYLHELLRTKTIYELRSDERYGGLEGFEARLRFDLAELGDARWVDFLLEETKASPHRGKYAHEHGPSTRQLALELKQRPQPRGRAHALATSMLSAFGAPKPGKHDAERLLAQVHQRPEDLSLRAVYADALSALGDVRGEFITLQLGNRRTPREAKLLKANLRGWAGGLDSFFKLEGRRYERGFFAGGTLAKSLTRANLARPEWRLITHLNLIGTAQKPQPWLLEKLPSLRSLEFHDEEHLALLFGHSWPLTSLRLTLDDDELGLAEKLTQAVFPQLARLVVHKVGTPRIFSWLRRVPLFHRLTFARVEGNTAPDSGWWKGLDASSSLETFELEALGWALVLTRDDEGRLARLTVQPLWSRSTIDQLMALLASGPLKASSVAFVPLKAAPKLTAHDVARALST